MKSQTIKRSLALASMLVAPLAVQAQASEVTLFGVMDLGLQRTSPGGKGSVTGVSNGGLSTSRLGFRGTEDLGNGWRAGFLLEGSLNPDTGTGRATNTNNQASGAGVAGGLTFDRNAYISLSGPYGELRMGHDFVPNHYNSIYFDPFNANGVARAGNLTFAAVGTGGLYTTITGSNTVSYWLPKDLGGVYGMVMTGFGENPSGQSNSSDGNFVGGRIGFAKGAWDVAAAVTRTKYQSTMLVGNYTHSNLGASWNAGFAKFFALYNQVNVKLTAGTVRKTTYEVGAHVPVSAKGKLRVSYVMLNDHSSSTLLNPNGSERRSNDARQFGIGYVHDMSKRTALYGTYAKLNNRGQGSYTVSGAQAPEAGRNVSGLEFGIRHLF